MVRHIGSPASGGLAVGKIKVINRRIRGFKRVVLATHREKALYEAAVILAKDEIHRLMQSDDGENKDILNFQLVMLDDNGLNQMILSNIESGMGGARAVEAAMEEYCTRLKKVGDGYLSRRTSDIRDVLGRVVDILDGRSRERFVLTEPSIIVADEIMPSDLATIDRQYALGFITVGGSYQSHANIIARTMGIPSITGLDSEILNPLNNGKTACMDGYSGEIFISPAEGTYAMFKHRIRLERRAKVSEQEVRNHRIRVLGGDMISIYANCNDPADIRKAIAQGVDGIGLVRSEILFMKEEYPTYERQLDFYTRCIKAAGGKPITIRTFDIGADKPVKGVTPEKEPNPALGKRGIRLQEDFADLFTRQITALYVAADRAGKVNVMLPMVTTVNDVTDFLAKAEKIKNELLEQGEISADKIRWGVMIETPAAALISDELARYVDFFSIGTNDLTQYTMVADRMNVAVADYYQTTNPAVLKLMEMTIANAKKHCVSVSVCGEAAADTESAKMYVYIGIRNLSMAPNAVLSVKSRLIEEFE